MGGRSNGALLEKTEPRRHGSSARYIRDPMTQGYRPGGTCRSCGTIPRKSFRSLGPLLVVSHYILFGRTVMTLQTPPDPRTPGQLVAGRVHYRRVCICAAHGKHCRLFSATSRYISRGNIFSRVVLGRPEPCLPPCSSRNSSRHGPCSMYLPNLDRLLEYSDQ